MKRSNTILSVLFLVILFAMAGYTLSDFDAIRTAVTDGWAEQEEVDNPLEYAADRTEAALNTALDREHHFIELYGLMQRVTRQRFVEDSYSYSVIRLDNDALTFGSVGQVQKDTSENAAATADFAKGLEALGIPFSAVMTPQKIPQGVNCVPGALRDYHNEEADQFLALLEENGLHTVDLRDTMGTDLTPYFFRTDHHWNADGAFLGNRLMTAALEGEYGFTAFAPGLDETQFTKRVYEDLFLGSQGKRVGTLYAGTDDFVTWHPTFDTRMTYLTSDTAVPRTGSLEQTLYFTQHLKLDHFNGNPYVTFAGGDWGKATVVNEGNPDGPTVVMIRDSFGCAITPFFALQCSKLTTIDLRAYRGNDLTAEIAAINPDFVVLLYSPSSTVSDGMFSFTK